VHSSAVRPLAFATVDRQELMHAAGQKLELTSRGSSLDHSAMVRNNPTDDMVKLPFRRSPFTHKSGPTASPQHGQMQMAII